MKLLIEILAWYGGASLFACTLLAIVGLLLAARRETRAVEEAMQRHPANGCDGFRPPRAEPKRAACGAWIGAESDDYWTRQFASIVHVTECSECANESQRKAA